VPEALIHRTATWVEIGLAVVTFIALLFIVAPYGRHERKGFGLAVPQRLAWILMEAPAVFVFIGIYALGDHALEPAPLILLGIWQLHYLQRTFVFPFRLRDPKKTTPIAVVLSAIGFNVLNAYVNARWISHFGHYSLADFQSFHFLIGTLMFVGGFILNIQADGALLRLRSPGSTGYKVPHGGLFEYVSSPNYLAELVEWVGWAILTWSLPGLAFALYTAGNLVPRAISNHRWYREKFPDYPKDRKAVLPFVL
jgi:3-oxo-5-alpha-steroid 4-dehydrogenase 1